jgi:hypothetical protein
MFLVIRENIVLTISIANHRIKMTGFNDALISYFLSTYSPQNGFAARGFNSIKSD